jgi:type II secretory pathway pseudopilin PulG
MKRTNAVAPAAPLATRPRRGYSLIEVFASLAIFLFGIVAIIAFFPGLLRASDEANLLTAASLLAQQKIAELRTDHLAAPSGNPLVTAIEARTIPSEPQRFPSEPRLAYSFHGRSLLDPVDDPGDTTDDPNIARLIVLRFDPTSPPVAANPGAWDILAEYRFDAAP